MLKLVLLLLTAGPGFRDTATSSVTMTGGKNERPSEWAITNVTYELAGLVLKGTPTDVVMRKTETMEFVTSSNERPRHFVLEGFLEFGPKARPTLRFEADGDSVEVWSTHYVVRRSTSIFVTTELYDVDTQKRFLVASSNVGRVVGKGPDQYVGYEVIDAKGVHGRLVLSAPSGAKSVVTFPQKEGTAGSPFGPTITADREKVRLAFGELVVVVPITGGKLNGKEESVVPLP